MRTICLSVIGAAALVGMGCTTEDPDAPQTAQVRSTLVGSRTAQLTTYTSYPACCPGSPVFDPHADRSECDDFSGCEFMGDFAAIGHKSFDFVRTHDLVAFYDDKDPNGRNFQRNYAGKTITLEKNGVTFNAIIADTCGNNDCDGCCRANSHGGFLVDMEFWTATRRIGGPDNADGTIKFVIKP